MSIKSKLATALARSIQYVYTEGAHLGYKNIRNIHYKSHKTVMKW